MKKLPIAEIEAGQVVARPVLGANGMALVQPGTVLSADLLSRLMNLHVDAVWVEGAGPDEPSISEQLKRLDSLFAEHENDPLMMEFKAVVVSRIQQGTDDGPDD